MTVLELFAGNKGYCRQLTSEELIENYLMLELNGLSKTFGGVKAVIISLRIEAKEVRGLIGPNGAGKSTLVNLFRACLNNLQVL